VSGDANAIVFRLF